MKSVRRRTLADQTADHLRQRLLAGEWGGKLPGVNPLCEELMVSQATVRTALLQLEQEGILSSGGIGRCRRVVMRNQIEGGRPLKVGIFLYDGRLPGQSKASPIIPAQSILRIQNTLETAGHAVVFPDKAQVELKHDLRRMVRQIEETQVDAWIVVSGSRPLLEWFSGQTVPCLALYGRSGGLPLARTGPDKVPAYLAATRRLVALGHWRIVLITGASRRKPVPGTVEQAFLGELAEHGIDAGEYNLPDWEETPEGFIALLESLFRLTPPTALIIEETFRLIAAMQFLAKRRMDVPGDVSLVSPDCDSALDWCRPQIAHMKWDDEPIVRRIARWVEAVRRGKADRKTINFPVEFVEGGSIGPVKGR
jgi:DNA-binding LacI/PurR family transcriptional regulator